MSETRKIKVCHISTAHEADDDRIFLKECVSLAEAGYEVYYVVQSEKKEIKSGVHIVPLKRRKGRFSRMYFGVWSAYFHALKTGSTVFHFHDPELLRLAFWFRFFGKKVIFDSHEDVPRQILSKKWVGALWIRRIVSSMYSLYEWWFVLFCHRVVSVTPEITDRFPLKKRVLVRNFPILSLAKSVDRSGRTKLQAIYAGGLSRIRGIKETIRAIAQLEGRITLTLLGKWNDDDYRSECESEPGWMYTHYAGSVSPDQVFDYYADADIGIALLYPEENYLKSLPVKAFEYMASGIPLIMSDFPYWKANFNEGVIFVNPLDENEIRKAIDRLSTDEKLRLQMGEEGKRSAFGKYSWQKESETLIHAYQELTRGN
ncbi:MAG TPA: glycosyltransferase [Bacteroidia bacterium]|nr:glycosyltransferase [Bacteroidia bacterium]